MMKWGEDSLGRQRKPCLGDQTRSLNISPEDKCPSCKENQKVGSLHLPPPENYETKGKDWPAGYWIPVPVLPGFLKRGLVVWAEDGQPRGVVTGAFEEVVCGYAAGCRFHPREELFLDLKDEDSRDRVLRVLWVKLLDSPTAFSPYSCPRFDHSVFGFSITDGDTSIGLNATFYEGWSKLHKGEKLDLSQPDALTIALKVIVLELIHE